MTNALKIAVMGVLITAATAHASSSIGNWILNSSSVEYRGAANELRVGYGTVVAGGSSYQVTATNITTSPPANMIWASSSTTNCPLSTTSLQGASSAYYLYYEGSTSTVVATTVVPFEYGIPQGSLYTKSGTTCTANAAGLYTFLGSFITDSNSNIVPFERHGERVLLNFNGGANPTTGFTWTDTQANEALAMTGFVYPVTAAALILEVQSKNTDLDDNHYPYIVDANNGTVNNATCSTGTAPLGIVWSGNIYPFTLVQERVDYPTSTTGGNNIEISVCDTVWSTISSALTVNVFYDGYIEPVPYLDQIR